MQQTYHLPAHTYIQRCDALYLKMRRKGIRFPAWIQPRVDKQASIENDHNVAHKQRAKARRRRYRAHARACQQAKQWKAEYDDARLRGERFVHAEPKPHPLLVALRKTTL